MTKIGIQAAPFSKAIHAGVLNKAENLFIAGGPQDVTNQAVFAVAEFFLKHYEGKAEVVLGNLKISIEVEEQVS